MDKWPAQLEQQAKDAGYASYQDMIDRHPVDDHGQPKVSEIDAVELERLRELANCAPLMGSGHVLSLIDALEKAQGDLVAAYEQFEPRIAMWKKATKDAIAERDSARALLLEIGNVLESISLGDVHSAQHYSARIHSAMHYNACIAKEIGRVR